jgi:transcriptional regulator with XRE-family HTH domain
MTQTATAGAAKVNVLTLSLVERGRLRPSRTQAEKIAGAIGVALGDVTEFAMLADVKNPSTDAAETASA